MNEFRIFAHGVDFNPDEYLSKTALEFDGVWRLNENGRGHPKSSGIFKYLGDGYNLNIRKQEEIAISFLSENKTGLKKLANFYGVTTFILGLQHQIDLHENVTGFVTGPSKELMELALDIGATPIFYVTIDRIDLRDKILANTDTDSQAQNNNPNLSLTNIAIEKEEDAEEILPSILLTTSFLIEEGLNESRFDQISNKLRHSIDYSLKQICKSVPRTKYTELFSYTYLEPDLVNCFKCENCGTWATNYEKPNEISGLPMGNKFEGMLVCDQCRCWKHHPKYGWANKTKNNNNE